MKNTKIIKGKGTVEIKTELGSIIVEPSLDPMYPGVYIDFKKAGEEHLTQMCLAEITPNADEEADSVRLLVWNGQDDYEREFVYAKKEYSNSSCTGDEKQCNGKCECGDVQNKTNRRNDNE